MRYLILSAATAALIALPLSAQTPQKPTERGTPGDPVWQGTLRMRDGRTFITAPGDNGIAPPQQSVKVGGSVGHEAGFESCRDSCGHNDGASGPTRDLVTRWPSTPRAVGQCCSEARAAQLLRLSTRGSGMGTAGPR